MKSLKLSISVRTFVGFLLLMLIFTCLHFWSIVQLRRVGDQLRILKVGYLPLTKLASQLEAVKLNMKPDVNRLLLLHSSSKLGPSFIDRMIFSPVLVLRIKRSNVALQKIAERISNQDRQFVKRLRFQLQIIGKRMMSYHRILAKLKQSKMDNQIPKWNRLILAFKQVELNLRREIRLLSLQMDSQLTQVVLNAERDERQSVIALLFLLLLSLVIGSIVLMVNIVPLRRIRKLMVMTERIALGDYQASVQIPEGDEIGQLAIEFNQMATSLHEREQLLANQTTALELAYHELQENSEQLLRSERLAAVGRIAAQITHEIRNPLNAIGLNLELLEEDLNQLEAPEEALSVLNSTMEEVDHLTSITKEYLRFAKLPKPQFESTQINSMLQGLIDFVSKEMSNRGISWSLNFCDALPEMRLDTRQLRQAFLNLLRNSMDAFPLESWGQGQIEITTRKSGVSVEVVIADNGQGIPKESQSQIFEPNYTTKEEGTGIGLYLAQQIIIGHSGRIEFNSEPGVGTEFIVFLPISTGGPSDRLTEGLEATT